MIKTKKLIEHTEKKDLRRGDCINLCHVLMPTPEGLLKPETNRCRGGEGPGYKYKSADARVFRCRLPSSHQSALIL